MSGAAVSAAAAATRAPTAATIGPATPVISAIPVTLAHYARRADRRRIDRPEEDVARIVPQGWRELEVTGAVAREIETLAILASGLPDSFTVFHGVHWTRLDQGTAIFGDISFVVVAPSGRLLLIEQRSGFLDETPEGLVQRHGGAQRRVALRIRQTVEGLRQRLAPVMASRPADATDVADDGDGPPIDSLLYCPDYTVRQPGTAGITPERIVDAQQRASLCARILAAFPDEPARPALCARLRRFFADELELVPDASALVGRAERMVTRLAGGLATWARKLEFEPFRLRVIGTAGSGKTQLALALLEDAARAGRRALYVCFNRPLADHVSQSIGDGATALTFHQWADRRVRHAGLAVDYGQPGAFERLEQQVAALPVSEDERIDELVVDEGQDFEPAWRDALLARLSPGARAWWLEDPMQNLYGRGPVELPGWVRLRADSNFRTPRRVLAELNRILAPGPAVEAAGPIAGNDVVRLAYAEEDADALQAATKRAVTLALQAGYSLSDIAVVTCCGRQRSRLLALDRLGPHRLRRWTGRYDLFGRPQYGEGDLLVETVYRFKGQSAPCIVFTEVDFERLDDDMRRKLFVGMTRASLALYLVLSRRAAARLPADEDAPATTQPVTPGGAVR